MVVKSLLVLALICIALCICLAGFTEVAHAQDSDGAKSSDKKVSQKRGVSGSLAGPEEDEGEAKGPNSAQVVVGIGSCVVAFIVFKWL